MCICKGLTIVHSGVHVEALKRQSIGGVCNSVRNDV